MYMLYKHSITYNMIYNKIIDLCKYSHSKVMQLLLKCINYKSMQEYG